MGAEAHALAQAQVQEWVLVATQAVCTVAQENVHMDGLQDAQSWAEVRGSGHVQGEVRMVMADMARAQFQAKAHDRR